MQQLNHLLAILASPATYVAVGVLAVVVGLVGSAIEKVGVAFGFPRAVALGKTLEAFAGDLPKALANLPTIFRGIKPTALPLLCFAFAAWTTIFLCACPPGTAGGTGGSGGSSSADGGSLWPDVAKCAPKPGDLIGEVTQILLSGGDYEKALEQEAIKDGGAAVVCAVNTLVSDWTSPGAARNALRADALARGQAFLAHVPTHVEAAPQ
jgi:hypothetical protein